MSRPHPETESGDRHVVELLENHALAAAVDGVGHGSEAAAAANAAISVLKRHADEELVTLLQRCHEELKGTRGAVMSLASFHGGVDRMSWLGIGNIQGILVRKPSGIQPGNETICLRGGIVGCRLPKLQVGVVDVLPGDTLVFATDGIKANFADRIVVDREPQEIADHIRSQYQKGTDDALVLVVRYMGAGS